MEATRSLWLLRISQCSSTEFTSTSSREEGGYILRLSTSGLSSFLSLPPSSETTKSSSTQHSILFPTNSRNSFPILPTFPSIQQIEGSWLETLAQILLV